MKVITDTETIELGDTEAKPTISITDFSRRVTDDFGVTTVVRRGFARRLSVRFKVPFDEADALQRKLADLRGTAAQWVADDSLDWLSATGFYKDFSIDLALPPVSYCTLTIEGLAETEAGADTGSDPAPDGQASTLRLLHPIEVTDAVLTSSTVAEADHAAWSSVTTYAAGARVIKAETHRIYESVASGNLGHDPALATGHWLDVGPTNRWAMFDQALGSLTTAPGSITVTMSVTNATGVALIDVAGTSVRVQAGSYDQTYAVTPGAAVLFDMPEITGSVIVTITGSGSVSVGTLLIGTLVPLGITEASPSVGIDDFSKKETDEYGEVTVVPRSWRKRMSAKALIRTDAIDDVANRIAGVRALPSLWIGDDGLDSLTIYGFFKDFSIDVGENVSTLAITIEGLSEAQALSASTQVALSAYLTKEIFNVAASSAGVVSSYSGAGGRFVVLFGTTEISENFSLSTADNPQGLTLSYTDQSFAVTGGFDAGEATASVTIRATGSGAYAGVTLEKTFSLGKAIPGPTGTTGQLTNTSFIVAVDSTGEVLSYDGAAGEFVIQQGATDVGANFTLSTAANPQDLTVVYTGRNYAVTGGFDPSELTARITIRATGSGAFAGQQIDRVFSLGKARPGEFTGAEEVQAEIDALETQIAALNALGVSLTNEQTVQASALAAQGSTIVQIGADLEQLGTDLTAQLATQAASITSLTTEIAAAGGDITTLQTTVASQGSQISTNATAISNVAGNLATLTTTVGTQGSTITSQGTAITTLQGNYATLSSTVSTQGSTITSQGTAITTLQGNYASLSSTVTTQGSTISSHASAISTLQGNFATLTTSVAVNGGRSYPERYTTGAEDFFTADTTGAPSSRTPLASNSTLSGFGPVYRYTSNALSSQDFGHRAVMPATPGKVYDLEAEVDVAAFTGADPSWRIIVRGLNATFGITTEMAAISQTISSTGAKILTTRISDVASSGVLAWPAGSTWLNPFIRLQKGTSTYTVDIKRLRVRDVSENQALLAIVTTQATAISTLHGDLASLTTTVGTQGSTITSQASAITTLQGNYASLSSTVSTQGSTISANASAITTLQGNLATLTTTVGTQGSTITSQASAITTLQGNYASLSSTVTAQGSTVTSNASAISTLQGQYATLNTVVGTQGSTISSQGSAISTLQGNVATLTTRVSASGANLLPNGGLENGFATGVANPSGFQFFHGNDWGPRAIAYGNGLQVFEFSPVYNPQIGAAYTFAIDPLQFGTSDVKCDILCMSGSTVLVDGAEHGISGSFDFDNTDTRRGQMACTVPNVPSGTDRLICRVFGTVRNGDPIGFRRAKLEIGAQWSRFSDEASVAQSFQVLSTLDSQYASLSSTVSTQGVTILSQSSAITTLNGLFGKVGLTIDINGYMTGWSLNNNGATGSFIINADYFAILKPGGGPRTEYLDGVWRTYAGSTMMIWGSPFGTSGQFVRWFGPALSNISDCSEGNAIEYLKTNGDAYFGGALSAGTLRNAVTGTSISATADVLLENIGSNGGTRQIVLSYNWLLNRLVSSGTAPSAVYPTATIRLYSGPSASGTLIGTLNVGPGDFYAEVGDPGQWHVNSSMSGSLTVNDTSGGTSASYYAVIVSRSIFTGGSGGTQTQRLTIVCTED